MDENMMCLSCNECGVQNCQKKNSRYPAFCPTTQKVQDGELEQLNQKLTLIADVLEDGNKPRLTFTIFVPDERKAGGKYVEVTDTVKRIDATARKVVLMSEKEAEGYRKEAESYRPHGLNKTLDFDKIVAIHGDLVDYMDNPDPA